MSGHLRTRFLRATGITLVVLLVFWLGNQIGYQVRTDHDAGMTWYETTDTFWHSLIQLPPQLSTHQTDLLIGLGTLGIVGLIILYNSFGRNMRAGEEHGSARWGTPADIAPFINRHKTENILFTRGQRLSLDTHKTQRNLNVLVLGSSGSGKSRYYIMPNLAQTNTSVVVTDPKGELLEQTAGQLRNNGYAVRVLNLVNLDQSSTFNPFKYFNPIQAEVDCAVLTELLIVNTSGKKPANSSDFWERAERALLNALVGYAYFASEPGEATLLDVMDLLAAMSASEKDETHLSPVDILFQAVNDLTTDPAIHTKYAESSNTDLARHLDGLAWAATQYRTFLQGAGETKKSIIISLGVRLAPLQVPSIRRILATDTIDLDTVGDRKTALFVVTPDTHQTFTFIGSIFYETLFQRNIYLADQKRSGHLDVPIQCFMDEFANIGQIPAFDRKIAVMRSRGISASVILQNYAQGKALYKDDWETIVGNCDSTLFLGGNEASTTEFISKRLGKETIHSRDDSEQRGTHGSWSISYRSLGRELLTPDELGRLPTNEAIYMLRGIHPFKSHKLSAPTFTGRYTPTQTPTPPTNRTSLLIEADVLTEPDTEL